LQVCYGVIWRQDFCDVVSIAASPDGKFVFVSDADGRLCCIEASTRAAVAEWKLDDATAAATGGHEPAVLTSLSAAAFSDDAYLIAATDSAGICFYVCARPYSCYWQAEALCSRPIHISTRSSVAKLVNTIF